MFRQGCGNKRKHKGEKKGDTGLRFHVGQSLRGVMSSKFFPTPDVTNHVFGSTSTILRPELHPHHNFNPATRIRKKYLVSHRVSVKGSAFLAYLCHRFTSPRVLAGLKRN